MKVLTIISKLEMGGIEKTLLSCLPHLISHGVQISVLCDDGGKLQPEYERQGVKIIDFAGYKKPFLDAKKLKQVLKSEKFDVVHSRFGHTSGVFAKVCYRLNIPFIVSIHNEKAMFRNSWEGKMLLGSVRSWYLNMHKKLTYKYASLILGHSKTNLNYFDDCPEEYRSKLQVIYNGIDFKKFQEYPRLNEANQNRLDEIKEKAEKIFVHVGKFKEQKNHAFMIEAFAQLNPIANKYYLLLLGEGPLQREIVQLVTKKGLEEQVWFIGMETNIAPYLYASDVFLFPSLYEGFGNVLVEAQYTKLLIAASAIGPHYEAVYKDYHPFFYNPQDVHDAAQKIERLCEVEIESYVENGFHFASDFSIEKMVDNLVNFYYKVR